MDEPAEKNMVKLSAQEIDNALIDRDKRKPIRRLMDDAVIPAVGAGLGAGAVTLGALGQLKQIKRLYEVS